MKQHSHMHRTVFPRTRRIALRRGAPGRRPDAVPVVPLAAVGTAVGAAVLWSAGPHAAHVVAALFVTTVAIAVVSRRTADRRAGTGLLPDGRRTALRYVGYRLAAAFAVLLVLPLLLAVALAVEVSTRGPVLLRRARAGAAPRLVFRCTDRRGRTTRLGRLLQRSSLDELPGLFDVVAGRVAVPGAPLPRRRTPPVPSRNR